MNRCGIDEMRNNLKFMKRGINGVSAFLFFSFFPLFSSSNVRKLNDTRGNGIRHWPSSLAIEKEEGETTQRKDKNCISSADSPFWRTLQSQWHDLVPSIYPSRIRYRGNKRWGIDEYSRKSFASTPHDRGWGILLTNPRFPLLRFHRETHCFSLRARHGCLLYHLQWTQFPTNDGPWVAVS